MLRFLKIKEDESFVGESSIDLPDGKKLIIEAAEGPEKAIIVSNTVIDADGETITSSQSCYCGGVLIGSANCPGNRIFCDCVNKRVSCY
jgi:hypothetical protein